MKGGLQPLLSCTDSPLWCLHVGLWLL